MSARFLNQLFRRLGYEIRRIDTPQEPPGTVIESEGRDNPPMAPGEGGRRQMENQSAVFPEASSPEHALYVPTFDFDGLWTNPAVIHNHDFMKCSRYVKAYETGCKSLGLDHKMYWRLHVALFFARHAMSLSGDFVECGVWRGFLSTAIMDYLDWNRLGRDFYLFDSFDGLVEPLLTEKERRNSEKIQHLNSYFENCYEDAVANFAPFDNAHLVKGTVPETLTQVSIEKVAFLSIDMNCAAPEIAAAEYFWEKMSPSAVILLDDYGFVSYEEQKNAFDEFARKKGVEILALPTGQGVIIKPS